MFDLDSHLQVSSLRNDRKYKSHSQWWLPSNPGSKFGGHLKWHPRTGATVFCGGALLNSAQWPVDSSAVIHGQTAGNCPVSLIWPLSYDGSSEPEGQEIKTWGLLVGANIESMDACIVHGLEFSFSGLKEWVSKPPLNADYTRAPDDAPTTQRTTYLVDMEPLTFGEIPSLGASCQFTRSLSMLGYGYRVTHSAGTRMVFHFDSPTTLSKAIALAWKLELFFTLLTGCPSLTKSMHLWRENARFDEKQALIFATVRKKRKRHYNRELMPVRLENVQSQFASILNSWLRLYDTLGPVLDLLAVALYRGDNDHFFEDRFLGVTVAVEGYCRILWHDTYVEKNAFDAIIPELLAVIKKANSPVLTQKASLSLRYQNEFSLRSRLTKLFEREPWLIPLLGKNNTGGVKAFVSKIVDNRNPLVHVDMQVNGQERNPVDDRVTRVLRAVLSASILEKIGVNPAIFLPPIEKGLHEIWW